MSGLLLVILLTKLWTYVIFLSHVTHFCFIEYGIVDREDGASLVEDLAVVGRLIWSLQVLYIEVISTLAMK